jgi:cytochrome b561
MQSNPLSAKPGRPASASLRLPGTGDTQTWSSVAKFLHWLVAALIVAQFALGWLASGWRDSSTKLDLFVWHKSTGMLILALVVLRLLWRLRHPAPALPADMPGWERRAAHASHALLYLIMIAMPLTGWIDTSAAGIPFRIYWEIPVPAIAAADDRTADLAGFAHISLGIAFAALLVLHVAAALRHHFIKRDDVLKRMLPERKTPR